MQIISGLLVDSNTVINNKNKLTSILKCPVCSGHETSSVQDVFDDRYGHPGLFKLVRCNKCNHLMTSPRLAEDELAHLYGTYYPRKNLSIKNVVIQASKVRLSFSKFRRWWMGSDNQGQYIARSGEKMLDIGCGSGLSLLEAQQLGVEAWGIEADPNVKRFAEELSLRIHQGSVHDNPFPDIKFDLIVLNQVIEHIPEPEKTLQFLHSRLTKDGRVILVFPNINSLWCKITGKSWINWHIPYHLHHFNKNTFTHMAERCGYNVVHTRTITPNIWTIMQLRASRQSIKRGQPNTIWEVTESKEIQGTNENHRGYIKKIFLSSILLVVAMVNRVVDGLGFGDSLMVEIKLKDSL